jgi:hypothetical protein
LHSSKHPLQQSSQPVPVIPSPGAGASP